MFNDGIFAILLSWGFLLHVLYKKGDYFTPPVWGRSIAEVGLNNIFYPLILSTIQPTALKTFSKNFTQLYKGLTEESTTLYISLYTVTG
jgi:hypothetical protein